MTQQVTADTARDQSFLKLLKSFDWKLIINFFNFAWKRMVPCCTCWFAGSLWL